MVKISNWGKDPLDNSTYYTYSINANNSKFQILGFLEDWSNVSLSMNPGFLSKPGLEWANADPASYSWRYVITKWDQLGILLNSTTLVPIQSANNPVDLAKAQASATYKAIFGNENSWNNMTASWASVFSSIYNKNTDLINNKTLASMDDSLVGYWDMETLTTDWSKLKDLSKYGNDGIGSGSIMIWWVNGKMWKATSFPWLNWNYIRIPVSNSLNFVGKGLTATLWFNTIQTSASMLFSQHNQWNSWIWSLFKMSIETAVECNIIGLCAFGGVSNWSSWYTGFLSQTKINNNNWHFIVISINSTNQKIFIDGKKESEIIWTYLLPSSLYDFTIWADYNWDAFAFSGSLDEIRIHNRALSDSEILNLYNATK
jgi:hypothetical protein